SLWHHDGDGNAEPAAMIGDALGVIAGRHRGHAALLFVVAEREQLVERAALLERGGVLQILELEMDVGARDATRRGADVVDGGSGLRRHVTLSEDGLVAADGFEPPTKGL